MSPLTLFARCLIACALLVCGSRLSAQGLVTGTLPNGLSYRISALPQSRDISVRLLVKAGSLDERPDEYGYAHFVEHLAFSETRDFPSGSLVHTLQRLGVAIGADLNARTGSTYTSYQLDLGESHRNELDTALKVLRNYTDGIVFTAAEVEQEKGIILSEMRARNVPAQRVAQGLRNAVYAGTAVATHDTIGTAEHIQAATPERLQALYERLYRADRMTMIIAGAFDATEMAAKIESLFGSIASRQPEPRPEDPTPPTTDRMHVVAHPIDGQIAIANLFTSVRREDETPESRRTELLQTLAVDILDRRLKARREAMPSQYSAASARLTAGPTDWVDHVIIEVQTASNRWSNALELAQVELRRAKAQGFTDAEVAEARTTHLAALRNRTEQIGLRSARLLAENILASAVRDRSWRSPSQVVAEAEAALQGASAGDILAAFNRLFSDQDQVVVLLPEKMRKPSVADVAEVVSKARTRTLRKNAGDTDELIFGYTEFGKAATVAERRQVAELDLDLIRLSNNVRVNLRPMVNESGRFHLTARIGRGTPDVPTDRPGISRLAGAVFQEADLGRHSATEVARLLDLHGVTRRIVVVDDQAIVNFIGPSSELTFALGLLTAMLSDLRPDPDLWPRYLGHYNAARRSAMGAPPGMARATALPLLANQDRRITYPTVQFVAQYSRNEVTDWMRGKWLRGPVEIGIVGHFLPDTLIDPLRETVGTLSRRNEADVQPKERLVAATQAGRMQMKFEGEAGSTASYLQWPVALNKSPLQGAAVSLASDILEDRVRRLLREKFGATYSPTSGLYRHATQREHAAVWVGLTLDPKEEKNMTGWVMAVTDELARKGASEDEFLRAIEPQRTAHLRNLQNPAWWLETTVSRAQHDPSVLAEASARATAWEVTTLADVNEAAQAFLNARVLIVIVTPNDGAAQNAK